MACIKWVSFPYFIKWYITGKCNIRCSHCYLTDYTKSVPLTQIFRFIDYFAQKKIASIVLLGGEPLFRHDLEQIVERITGYGIGLKIATNGMLATESRARTLVQSGAKQFQVSLEGVTSFSNDKIRGNKTFEKAVEGIRHLKNAGAWVAISFTASHENAHEICAMYELAQTLGVDRLKVGAFIPVGTGKLQQNILALTEQDTAYIRKTLHELKSKYPKITLESAFCDNDNKSSCSFGCGAGTSNLVVNSDLSLSACDLLVEEDRTKIRVQNPEEIEALWQTHPLFNKWRRLEPDAKLPSIPSFTMVHQKKCQVAYSAYQRNIFEIPAVLEQ